MKYITTKERGLIIFSKGFTHKEMSQGHKILGAGFIKLSTGEPYGLSVSLGLGVHEEDPSIIRCRLQE